MIWALIRKLFMRGASLEDGIKTYYAKEIRSDAKKYAADFYKSLLKGLEIKFEENFGHKEIEIYGTNSEDNEETYQVGPFSPQSNNEDQEFFTTLFNEESTNTNYGDRTINFNNDTAFCTYRILFKNNSYQNTTDNYAHIKIKSLKWIYGTEIV